MAENSDNFENVSGVHSDSEESHKDEDEEMPDSAKSSSRLSEYEKDIMKNPFRIPNDNDIFLIRDKERQRKKQERLRQRTLKVHEKSTSAAKLSFREAALIRGPSADEEELTSKDGVMAVKQDPGFTIAVTRDRQVEKDSLTEYITKKREMFLLQYSIGVKREEMRKLEEMATAEEKKLELAEQYLEEDAAMFDEFLKENDRNSVEAIKIAEEEAKLKFVKVQEIKRLNASMMQIKSEINKYQEQLSEYKMYRGFLERLIPEEIRKDREVSAFARKEERRRKRLEEETKQSSADLTSKQSGGKGNSRSNKKSGTKIFSMLGLVPMILGKLWSWKI